jgi:hypothetical protein
MDTIEFWALLQRHSGGDEGAKGEILAAIAADPGIVGRTWEPEQEGWEDIPLSAWTWCFKEAGYLHNEEPAEPPEGPTLLRPPLSP